MNSLERKLFVLFLVACASQAPGGSNDPLSVLRGRPRPFGVGDPIVGVGLARSIAFDGSNYVVALKSSPSNLVTAQFLGPTADPFGAPINLAEASGAPLVSFDGTNYLIVWADPGLNMNGQFMNRQGAMVGGPFLISHDADSSEAGAIGFDGNHYLVLWEANGGNANTISSIHGQFVTPSGTLLGNRIQMNADSEYQRFPALAFDGVNFLAGWVAAAGDTNLWRVKGCFLSTSGVLQPAIVLSQTAAASANPIALAFAQTNYLVAWSREVGPYVAPDYCDGNGSALFTNSWPMTYGRILSQDGVPSGPEFQISPHGFTTHPSVASDGTNFLVSSLDKYFYGPYCGWQVQPIAIAQEITQSGGQEPGLLLGLNNLDAGFASIFAGGQYVLIQHWSSGQVAVHVLLRETAVQPSLQNFGPVGTNRFGCQLVGNQVVWFNREGYTIEFSTNLVDWTRLDGIMDAWQGVVWPGTISWDAPSPGADRTFYRALTGKFTCIRNQRLLLWAERRWGFENNKSPFEIPTMDQLVGPGKYLPEMPVCPNGGTYRIYEFPTYPTCSFLGGHDGFSP